jgi:hypothetical protein
MAGDKVNNYSQVDSNILELQLTTDKTFKGYHQLTLTNYDNTTVPAIAAGSCIEVNGALYKFDSEEAISTTDPVTSAAVADGTVYVCIIPDTTTATAAFTATAPTWSDSKQGWYGTGGQANYRYVEYAIVKSGLSYTKMMPRNDYGFKTNIILEMSSSQDISATGEQTIIFNSELYDALGEYNSSTGVFTVKQTGFYLINGFLNLASFSSSAVSYIRARVNGESSIYTRALGAINGSAISAAFTGMFFLKAGDYFVITVSTNDSSYTINYPYTQCNVSRIA